MILIWKMFVRLIFFFTCLILQKVLVWKMFRQTVNVKYSIWIFLFNSLHKRQRYKFKMASDCTSSARGRKTRHAPRIMSNRRCLLLHSAQLCSFISCGSLQLIVSCQTPLSLKHLFYWRHVSWHKDVILRDHFVCDWFMQAVVKHWHSGIYLADENPNMYHQCLSLQKKKVGPLTPNLMT